MYQYARMKCSRIEEENEEHFAYEIGIIAKLCMLWRVFIMAVMGREGGNKIASVMCVFSFGESLGASRRAKAWQGSKLARNVIEEAMK